MIEKPFAPYARLRKIWNEQVNEDTRLSKGDKRFATFVCVTYVNNRTGKLWPKNKTVAAKLGVSIRSIKRYFASLTKNGYLEPAKVPGNNRAFRICLPDQKGDIKEDNLRVIKVTAEAPNGDAFVTPNKNKVNNKETNERPRRNGFQSVQVSASDINVLENWASWVSTNTDFEIEILFQLLEKRGAYFLPCRYPKDENSDVYKDFFKDVVFSKGNSLPG